MKALQVRDLRLQYERKQLFDHLALDLYPGGCRLLCGDNGAGKSSLLRILAGLQPADSIHLLSPPTTSPRKAAALLRRCTTYLHQHPYLFRGTVLSNLKLALPRSLGRKQRERQLDKALVLAGIEHLALREAIRLSGGERQRLALARAWLRGVPFLLLDEPTANLDSRSRARTLDLLDALLDEGRSLLVATHDPQHFPAFMHDRLRLHNGRLGIDPHMTPATEQQRVLARPLPAQHNESP